MNIQIKSLGIVMHYMEKLLHERGKVWAYCLRNGVFVPGRYATNGGDYNVDTFAEVKARVMRLASDGTILLKVPLVRLRRFLSMSSHQISAKS
jgi:hypothetical protein